MASAVKAEGTDTALVFGVVDGKTVDGSPRRLAAHAQRYGEPGHVLEAGRRRAFGLDEERRMYHGGGNVKDKGGFRIPPGFLARSPDRDLLYRMTCEVVQEKFLEAIGRKSDPKK